MCLLPDQSKVFCYARVVLAKDVTFENNAADGWAIGDLKWLAGVETKMPLYPEEIAGKVRPDALKRMPIDGWLPLWYRPSGQGFWCYKRQVLGARWLLLAPGLVAIRVPRLRETPDSTPTPVD